MERKLRRLIMITVAITVIITASLCATVFYSVFRNQIRSELVINAKTIAAIYETTAQLDGLEEMSDELRVTLIQKDGTVVYDNTVNADTLENHLDREEVLEAVENGNGSSERVSENIGYTHFYYAMRLEDSNILRVSCKAGSVYSLMLRALPMIMLITAVVCIAAAMLSNNLMRHFVQVINDTLIKCSSGSEENVIKELLPVADSLIAQSRKNRENERIRREFTANVSHELKTPLTSISGYAELIETGLAKGEDAQKFAGTIHSEASRMLALIGDIIELSELETFRDEDVFERVDLYQICQQAESRLSLNAKNAGITMKLSGSSAYVMGDKTNLEELAYNLIDNAIRYNVKGGSINISSYIDGNKACLCVRDTGIGIPEQYQNRIFERFFRVDKSRSKQTGGTGLGLAIVKHIAVYHGANITIKSKEMKGTSITVTFPIAQQTEIN
ncbi:MAG: two-component sensor histidine kinase [Clostridiales bacterium]|nr:two-component sensor histidine kinase [Clostridiales bacterium]